jgi:hypothetical protein
MSTRIRGARVRAPTGTIVGRLSAGSGELEFLTPASFLNHPLATSTLTKIISKTAAAAAPNGSLQYNNNGVFGGANVLYSESGIATFTAQNGLGILFNGALDTGMGGGSLVALAGDDAGNGAGVVAYTAGASNTTGVSGGSVNLSGGSANVGDANGGDVNISPGTGLGTGTIGNLRIMPLPTSDPGIGTGVIWADNGVLVYSGFTAAQGILPLVNGDTGINLMDDGSSETIGVPITSNRPTTRLKDWMSQGSGSPSFQPNVSANGTALYYDNVGKRAYMWTGTGTTWSLME